MSSIVWDSEQGLGVQSAESNSLPPGQCFHGDMRGPVSEGFSLMSLKGRTVQGTDLIWVSNVSCAWAWPHEWRVPSVHHSSASRVRSSPAVSAGTPQSRCHPPGPRVSTGTQVSQCSDGREEPREADQNFSVNDHDYEDICLGLWNTFQTMLKWQSPNPHLPGTRRSWFS